MCIHDIFILEIGGGENMKVLIVIGVILVIGALWMLISPIVHLEPWEREENPFFQKYRFVERIVRTIDYIGILYCLVVVAFLWWIYYPLRKLIIGKDIPSIK